MQAVKEWKEIEEVSDVIQSIWDEQTKEEFQMVKEMMFDIKYYEKSLSEWSFYGGYANLAVILLTLALKRR